ncbi:MAG: DsbA family protein [Gammaproteobacteria bacterium]|nr:DsbA family protein [Gammaproteobacteria bacterium]
MKKLSALLLLTLCGLFVANISLADNPSTATPSAQSSQGSAHDNPNSNASFSPSQVQDIQKIVHDYLVSNPNVLVEASQALQAQQMAQMQKAAMVAIAQNKAQLFNDPETPVAGNPNGSVYLVEFFDYQCGHCREMAAIVDKIIKDNPNVKVIFKDWPIFGGASKFAAQASIAAYMQSPSKFYAFHNALYQVDPPLTSQTILDLASKNGLDVAKLSSDMKSPAIEKQLRENFQLAQALRFVGTPGFVLSNQQETNFKYIPGATDEQTLQQNITALK